MLKVIVLMIMCVVYKVASSPTVLFSKPVVTHDDIRNTKPAHLPGIVNLAEKSLMGIELQKPIIYPSGSHVSSFSSLPGTRNNAERIQIERMHLRGIENLAEKAIPEAVIARMSIKH